MHKNITTLIVFLSVLLLSSCAGTLKNVQVETLTKSTTSWDGQTLPDYPKGQPQITILRIKIPAGAKLEMHRHPVINAGVMISGELMVITENNETLRIKAGDAIIEVVDKWHFGKNEGSNTAEIIVFYAGVVNQPITVKHDSGTSK